ncbi:MAG TPA: GGDEF domain-containing protein [Candidatus Limnocylindrales bacterium]|nr:GGDEF domain-containing protein [Candidatus Limnocylindrales bacterium]
MTAPDQPGRHDTAEDRRIRRSWVIFGGSFLALGMLAALQAIMFPTPFSWATLALLGVVGIAAIRHRVAVQSLETDRRVEAESFARILQGLSRSVSPDAIIEAIVEELGAGTGADHIVVVRRRPDSRVLEATLVNARTGGPTSTTLFPISDLEDPPAMAEADRREPVAIPIEVRTPVLATPAGPATPAAATPPAVVDASRTAGRPRSADDAELIANRIATRARRVYGLKHTLAAPLTAGSGVIGAIVVSRRTADPWPASAQRILGGAAAEASAALSRAYSHRQAEARAATDALTGLPNRRYFDEYCSLLSRRRRAEDAIGILMVDIDRFKRLNDTHGHAVGDEVLRSVAGAIAGAVREDDVPARYGGEEFAVVLRNPSRGEAVEVGERIRDAVASLDLRRIGVASTSVSVGVAVADEPGRPIPEVIERADNALYEAKRQGRDRVIAA